MLLAVLFQSKWWPCQIQKYKSFLLNFSSGNRTYIFIFTRSTRAFVGTEEGLWETRWKWHHSRQSPRYIQNCIRRHFSRYQNTSSHWLHLTCHLLWGRALIFWASGLRRIKSFMRSTMNGDRLSSLALMHLHRARTINASEICQKFPWNKVVSFYNASICL